MQRERGDSSMNTVLYVNWRRLGDAPTKSEDARRPIAVANSLSMQPLSVVAYASRFIQGRLTMRPRIGPRRPQPIHMLSGQPGHHRQAPAKMAGANGTPIFNFGLTAAPAAPAMR